MTDPTALGAVCVASAFASAAFYASFIDGPARSALAPGPELQAWQRHFPRAKTMQGGLALLGSALGWQTYRTTADPAWKVGAALLFACWPWTLLVIAPVYRGLLAQTAGTARTHAAILHWLHLHHVRTGLGLLAAGTMFAAMTAK